MNILITGVHGFVGSNLYSYLKRKYKIFGIGRNNKYSKLNHQNILSLEINKKSLKKINFQPDILIHCAGSGSVSKSLNNKKKDYKKNVLTSKYIINYLKEIKKKPKVIIFSSAAVYGNSAGKKKKKILPASPYGVNKLKSEKIFKESSKKLGFKLQILRFYSIYGEGLRKQLIWDACNKILLKKNYFYGSGEEIRSWTHINDVCKFIDTIISKPLKKNCIVDVSSNDVLKNKIILKKLFKLFNYNFSPHFNKIQKKGDPLNQIYVKKYIQNINWSPSVGIDEGLKKYFLWFKKQKK